MVIWYSSTRKLIHQVILFLLKMRANFRFHITKTTIHRKETLECWKRGRGGGGRRAMRRAWGPWNWAQAKTEVSVSSPLLDDLLSHGGLPHTFSSAGYKVWRAQIHTVPVQVPTDNNKEKAEEKTPRPALHKKQMIDSPLHWPRWLFLTF